jgi:Co/Zn/Cd efflux system component
MSFGSHGHSHIHSHHNHGHDHEKSKCCHLSEKFRLSSMLGMTFLFFIFELVIGQITKSVALTTDAFHMLSDTISLVIALISVIVSLFILKLNNS